MNNRLDEIMARAIRRLENTIPIETPGTWYHEDIPFLLSEVERLQTELERVTAERDMAVEDLSFYGDCDTCIFENSHFNDEPCNECFCNENTNNVDNKWQWRGLEEPNDR